MTASTIDLASRLGLHKLKRSWRGRCPACQYGGDTFSLRAGRDEKPLAYCASCQDADAIRDALSRIIGEGQAAPTQLDDEDKAARRERKRERALALWRGSEPAVGTLADIYLTARGLPDLAASDTLRFRLDTPHPEGGRLPAMLALVTDAAGTPIAIHRTYLRRDGARKANVEPAKASLGPVWHGAIRLDPVAGEMVIGEGIETSASAGRLIGLPAWAAINAGNLARGLVLPPEVRRVVVARDADQAGDNAARAAWLRWRAEGRRVEIATPGREGSDFNDVLRAREAAHVG